MAAQDNLKYEPPSRLELPFFEVLTNLQALQSGMLLIIYSDGKASSWINGERPTLSRLQQLCRLTRKFWRSQLSGRLALGLQTKPCYRKTG